MSNSNVVNVYGNLDTKIIISTNGDHRRLEEQAYMLFSILRASLDDRSFSNLTRLFIEDHQSVMRDHVLNSIRNTGKTPLVMNTPQGDRATSLEDLADQILSENDFSEPKEGELDVEDDLFELEDEEE